jgi:hypothetical protein
MRFVMQKAISLDEEAVIKEEALLSRLWTENKVNDIKRGQRSP